MIFVDSNVWLYGYASVDHSGDKHSIALAIADRNDVCISSQVVNEVVFNILRKKFGNEDYVAQIIDELYDDYLVLSLLKDDIAEAVQLRKEYRFGYWDSIIVATALRAQATDLFSEDMQNGLVVRKTLTIRNPFED